MVNVSKMWVFKFKDENNNNSRNKLHWKYVVFSLTETTILLGLNYINIKWVKRNQMVDTTKNVKL